MILHNFIPNTINSTYDIFTRLDVNIDGDVSIINLDSNGMKPILNDPVRYNAIFSDSKYRIVILHELSMASIPYLKLADHIIYLTERQKKVVQDIVGLKTPSTVLPYPIVDMPKNEKKNRVLFLADYDGNDASSLLHIASTWNQYVSDSDGDAYSMVDVSSDGNARTIVASEKRKREVAKMEFTAVFNVINRDGFSDFTKTFINAIGTDGIVADVMESSDCIIDEEISYAKHVYVHNKEMSTDTFDECHSTRDQRLVYTTYKDNALLARAISAKSSVIISNGVSTDAKSDRPTVNQWIDSLKEILATGDSVKTQQRIIKGRTPIDVPNMINITEGSPLSTDFVFIVNYRNQETKIKRALKSILAQNKKFSFGIAVTDDASTDGSVSVVKEVLSGSTMPYVINENKERKYSARNLWNSSRFLVKNMNAILIELDGDDFLSTDVDILQILTDAYSDGCMKTAGSFKCYPNEWKEMESNQERYDIRTPWCQNVCSVWIPLRTYRKSLFEMVEVDYFLERDTKQWLKQSDDASIGPRMIELADRKVKKLDDVMYVYDTSGANHDAGATEWNPWYSHTKLYHAITF